jgi:hypothetical protein
MQAGHADAVAAVATIVRSMLWHDPHWSPMPQRCRSRTEVAPLSIALEISRSDLPRQMQMIKVSFLLAVFETESQYTHHARSIPRRQYRRW